METTISAKSVDSQKEIETTRTLMYIFLATTIILLMATIYLIMKRK